MVIFAQFPISPSIFFSFMKAACVAQKTKSKPNNNKTRKTKQKPYTQQKTQAAKTNPNNNKIKTNLQTIT